MTNTVTWDALAAALGVAVRDLHRARKIPTSPGDSRDLVAWQEFLTASKAEKGVDLQGLTPTSYDDALASGRLGFDDAKQHALIVEQEIINESRREELKKARGHLMTIAKVREFQAELVRLMKGAVGILPDIATADLPAHERPDARTRADRWVADIFRKLDGDIASWTGPKT